MHCPGVLPLAICSIPARSMVHQILKLPSIFLYVVFPCFKLLYFMQIHFYLVTSFLPVIHYIQYKFTLMIIQVQHQYLLTLPLFLQISLNWCILTFMRKRKENNRFECGKSNEKFLNEEKHSTKTMGGSRENREIGTCEFRGL